MVPGIWEARDCCQILYHTINIALDWGGGGLGGWWVRRSSEFPHMLHATLLHVLLHFHSCVTLRCCTFSCASRHTSSYVALILICMLRYCTFSCTSTRTSCYAAVRSLCTSTHTSCYAAVRSLCTSTHTSCYAAVRSFCTSTRTSCYAAVRSLCTSTHTSCYAAVRSLCTSTSTSCHALLYVHLHFHTYVMLCCCAFSLALRCCKFSCASTHTSWWWWWWWCFDTLMPCFDMFWYVLMCFDVLKCFDRGDDDDNDDDMLKFMFVLMFMTLKFRFWPFLISPVKPLKTDSSRQPFRCPAPKKQCNRYFQMVCQKRWQNSVSGRGSLEDSNLYFVFWKVLYNFIFWYSF